MKEGSRPEVKHLGPLGPQGPPPCLWAQVRLQNEGLIGVWVAFFFSFFFQY
jgi:hypothetical protein